MKLLEGLPISEGLGYADPVVDPIELLIEFIWNWKIFGFPAGAIIIMTSVVSYSVYVGWFRKPSPSDSDSSEIGHID